MRQFLGFVALAVMTAGGANAQDAGGTPAPPPPPTPETTIAAPEWRTAPAENLLVIDTTKGRILVELTPEVAPLHVERIRLLARRGFYDGVLWHRVIDWFMAQTGDPLGNGEGQSPYPDLKAEFTFRREATMPFAAVAEPAGARVGFFHSLPVQTQPDSAFALTADGKVHAWGLYCPGVAGMARDEGNDTANSQFFLMRQAYPALDKRYTIWGVTVSGLDVVRSLQVGDGDNGMMTQAQPDRMTRVRIAADIPEAERPSVQVLATASPRFRALVEETRAARGADFSVCDVVLPVQVVN
ncbi:MULTISPECIES: peptidylprolyl isomerase [unclassified Brevundimonas]|uniref:peptidylprolyl isomerase n=1 Tax=unclassified Brevundimonas TaxID=2622653 RepID=UPI0006FDC7BA|nr:MULTISPECIES: peptidylprolyl isomerase [unclassified Brevundimonas]KQY93068.1 peptidylprolyl isomerase [Brevundimonas sp. Root1423]KRA27163.1 peptidylprolyl isomerase [Brevundimonas sp. Root608]